AASVVESVVRRVVGRLRDMSLEPAFAVAKPDAAAQRDDEPAALAKLVAADRFRHRHRDVVAARRIEAVERRRVDVDPVERLLVDRPQRTLGEARASVENAGEAGGRGGHRGDERAAASATTPETRIVQEKTSPGASTRAPVCAAPSALRLNASVSCETG